MNRVAVSTNKNSRRGGGAAQDPTGVRHAAEHEPHGNRGPRAEAAFEHPQRRQQRRYDREDAGSMSGPTPEFRQPNRQRRRHRYGWQAEREGGQDKTRDYRQPDSHPCRPSELVVCLSDTLRPKLTRSRGQSPYEHVARVHFPSAGCLDGSDQLQVLEQHISVVAAGSIEDTTPDAQRAWPVATGDSIDQTSRRIEAGVPGQWAEEVLGPDDLSVLECAEHRREGGFLVTHVIISDHEKRVQGAAHPSKDAGNLSVGEGHQITIDADVFDGPGTPRMEVRIDRRIRSVDHDDLSDDVEIGKEVQVHEQFVGHGRSKLDREDVGHRRHEVATAIHMPTEPAVGVEASEQARWADLAREAADRFGTPCYLNRATPVLRAVQLIERRDAGVRSWLSYKTHPLPRLLEWWIAGGRGVEVVSESEFLTACSLGCSPDQLLINGPAKHAWLTRYPLPELRVHFDSPRELTTLLPLALSCKWRVGVRIHAPDERDARNPVFGGPFGMTADETVDALRRLQAARADVQSVHSHLGQAPQNPDAYVRTVQHAARLCEAAAFRPRYADLGGGLPSPPAATSAVAGLWRGITAARAHFPGLEQIWLENGRFITEQSAALVIRILDIKDRAEGRYVICDGGRTNHALAADHGMHPLLIVPHRTGPTRLTTICGPTCMTDDTLGRVPLPEDLVPGDVLVWMNAGAYHLPWETRFSHGLCAVVWADEAEHLSLVREREHVHAFGTQ